MKSLELISQTLKIVNKRGSLTPLEANSQQIQILRAIQAQAQAKEPIRIIVLKARQLGVSTIVQAVMFMRCLTEDNHRALVAAHTDDASAAIFDKTVLFERELPPVLRKPLEYSSRKEISWAAPHRASFAVQTAGRKALARGLTLQSLHASEVAFWSNPSEALLSALQTVPDDPNTMVVLESTANGMGGEFYERWMAATRHQAKHPGTHSGYVPLFFSWLDFPEYRRVLPSWERIGELDSAEQELRSRGASDEQLYWRRCMIRDACGGDAAKFCQEYPSTPEESFQMSGRPALPIEAIRRHASMIRPGRNMILMPTSSYRSITARESTKNEPFAWEIWHEPTVNGQYTLGADVAEGILSDPENPKSDPDYSAIAVYNRKHNRIDAVFRGRIPPDRLGEQVVLAGRWYNTACVAPEINGPGFAVIEYLKASGYPRIYRRRSIEDRYGVHPTAQLGWKTTAQTRDQLIDAWAAAIRPDRTGSFEDSLDLYSARLLEEEQSFQYKKNGKREHMAGRHDDLLIAAMIAHEVHRRIAADQGRMVVVDYEADGSRIEYDTFRGISRYDRRGIEIR